MINKRSVMTREKNIGASSPPNTTNTNIHPRARNANAYIRTVTWTSIRQTLFAQSASSNEAPLPRPGPAWGSQKGEARGNVEASTRGTNAKTPLSKKNLPFPPKNGPLSRSVIRFLPRRVHRLRRSGAFNWRNPRKMEVTFRVVSFLFYLGAFIVSLTVVLMTGETPGWALGTIISTSFGMIFNVIHESGVVYFAKRDARRRQQVVRYHLNRPLIDSLERFQ
ncbi:hypothetical protein QR680_007724 [Steinernema hermaphroditum]|uniref:Uncharacterized protein n=1 Tax=Steinernema hermaphroditum TaxID=289476 RepID=A0AA39IE42_9BILA|nr:hypothetical protein QR680_007724 [Steinernema hermaphroditum]